jgi:hypothetical protein
MSVTPDQIQTAPPPPGDLSGLTGQLRSVIRLLSVIVIILGLHLGWAVFRQQTIHKCVQDAGSEISIGESAYCLAN